MGIVLNSVTSAYYCVRRGVQVVKKQSNYMAGLHAFTYLFAKVLFSQEDITINVKQRTIGYDRYISEFVRSVLPESIAQALENKQIDSVQISVNNAVEDFIPYGTMQYLLRNSFRALALHGIKDMSVYYDFSSIGSDMGGDDFTINGVAKITLRPELVNAVQIDIDISQKD